MLKKRKQNFLAAMTLALVLTLLTTACETTQVVVKAEIPEVTFPVFPSPDAVTMDDKTEVVSMPLWYWEKIGEYNVDVKAIEEYLNKLRAIEAEKEK